MKSFLHRFQGSSQTGEIQRLFLNIGITTPGIFFAIFSLAIANLIISRTLGPSGYGQYSLVLTVSQLLLIPMLFSLHTAATQAIASSHRPGKIISTSFIAVCLLSTVTVGVLYLLRYPVSSYFHVSQEILLLSMLISLALSFKELSGAFIKGLHRFFIYSFLEAMYAFFILVVSLSLIFLNHTSFQVFLFIYFLGILIYVIPAFAFSLKNFVGFSKAALFRLLGYAVYGILGSLGGFMLAGIDKLVINKFLGSADLGLYTVYLNAATLVITPLMAVTTSVLFPSASAKLNSGELVLQIEKKLKIIFLPLAGIIFITIAATIAILGKQYSFVPSLALIISFSTVMFAAYQILLWINNARGNHGIRQSVFTVLSVSAVSVAFMYFSVRSFGIYGSASISFLTNTVLYLIFRSLVSPQPSKQTICFVSYSAYSLFFPSQRNNFGGSEVQLYLLAKNLSKNYLISFVVGDFGQEDVKTKNHITFYKISTARLPFRPINALYYYFSLIKSLHQTRAQIFIQRAAGVETGIIAFYCLLFRKKFIFMTANDGDCNGDYVKRNGLKGLIYLFGLKSATLVITQASNYQKTLKSYQGIKSIVIPSGHDLDLIGQRRPRKIDILWVGRLDPIKKPEIFLELARRLPQYKFTMIAPPSTDKTYFQDIKKQAKSVANLQFIAFVPFRKISEYFSRSKIFVNTSLSEGFPNTFVQAAIAGVPIVSYSVNPDNFLDKYGCGKSSAASLPTLIRWIKKILHDKRLHQTMSKQAIIYSQTNHNIKNSSALLEAQIIKLTT